MSDHGGVGEGARRRRALSFEIGAILGPGSKVPGAVVHASVDSWRIVGAITDVSLGDDPVHARPIVGRVGQRPVPGDVRVKKYKRAKKRQREFPVTRDGPEKNHRITLVAL